MFEGGVKGDFMLPFLLTPHHPSLEMGYNLHPTFGAIKMVFPGSSISHLTP